MYEAISHDIINKILITAFMNFITLAIISVWVLVLNPPHAAMIPPPAIIPKEKEISSAERRQTSSSKLRTTCRGVRNEAGAINIKNSIFSSWDSLV